MIMIMVRFFNLLTHSDNDWTEQMDFADWLKKQIPSLDFDCMDYPYDDEDCYDCYFQSSSEQSDAIAVYHLLKDKPVDFSVIIVDDKLNFIKEITEG